MRARMCLATTLSLLATVGCGGENGGTTRADASAPGTGGGSDPGSTGGISNTGGINGTGGSTLLDAAGGPPADAAPDRAIGSDAMLNAADGGNEAPVSPSSCAPWPVSDGTIVSVSPTQASTLHALVLNAAAGTTFVLQPGSYLIAGSLRLEKPGLTLRSSTDRADDVVIDAAYDVAEAVVIRASNATVAHVTITHAVDHAIHVSPPSEGVDVTGLLVYGVTLTDNGEQFLKVNPIGSATGYVDGGRVECSTFLLTEQGRPHIERSVGGCYTGGIDVHAGLDWIVRNNRFEGIYCAGEGLAEHAIHFWKRSRGSLVENNLIINCARGVGFGMGDTDTGARVYSDTPYGGDLGHIDGVIRNNVIYADIDYFDTGIEIIQARQPVVVHNTVVSWAGAGFFSSIDYRFGRTQARIQNNLTRRITVRDGAGGTVDHNLENTPQSYFVAPTAEGFHLADSATEAIDHGVVVAEAGLDIDGEPHTHGAPDLGADER